MIKFYILLLFFIPLLIEGQELSSVKNIDSIVSLIDNDPTIIKKMYDTVTYEKLDGTNNWDSAYHHEEFFYKNRQLVRLIAWYKYKSRRTDMLAYYQNGKTIKFSKGESFKGQPDYGNLNFAIYYYNDNDINVEWLTAKPDNVLGVATDIFLKWAYQLQQKAR